MNTQRSKAEVDAYREQGFLAIPELLTMDKLDQLAAAVSTGVTELGAAKLAGVGPSQSTIADTPGTSYDRVFLQRVNLWRIDDTVRGFVAHPDLGRMLCDLEWVDGIRIWHDQTL